MHTANIFTPRVEYKNIIIFRAQWDFENKHFKKLLEYFENDEFLLGEIKKFQKAHSVPKYIVLAEGDNELVVNLENLTSVKMFLRTIKKKENIVLKEFLYNEQSLVKGKNGFYANQIIVSFYNALKVPNRE